MTPEQEVLSRIAKSVFHLNGRFLTVAEDLAAPVGLTAARWQVLGTIVTNPMSVADVARELGLARQSVQRIADLLVEDALAEYRPNPAHRRAKLLCLTPRGRAALDRIRPGHAAFAEQLAATLGYDEFRRIAEVLDILSEALDEPQMDQSAPSRTVAATQNGTQS